MLTQIRPITRRFVALAGLMAGPAGAQSAGDLHVNPLRDAYFGDLHLHTSYSFDAYVVLGARVDPDQAYKFAQGKPITYLGSTIVRREPLDFLAVTDHAENIGVFNTLEDPNSALSRSPLGQAIHNKEYKLVDLVSKLLSIGNEISPGVDAKVISHSAWRKSIDIANANYQPGKFTTFIAYEWTSLPNGQNLHRNVIFRGNDAPDPFSAADSEKPENLWNYLDAARRRGYESLAIPHNSNASNGLMFDWVGSDGKAIDRAYALQRIANEPLVEIIQNKGASETHPDLSSNDEFANYEIFDTLIMTPQKSRPAGSYVRDALGRGLVIENTTGVNPYKLGFVGASDLHAGLSFSNEADYAGDVGAANLGNGRPSREGARLVLDGKGGALENDFALRTKAGSLTGVWAESNTREAIYDALRRKETFATSGTKLKFRFFGGWGFTPDVLNTPDWVKAGYARGVPMGGDLPQKPSGSPRPSFIVWALKDPNGANLDRVQIVKVWLDQGQQKEKIYDVAFAGPRKPDPATGKLPPVGNSVNVRTASYANDIGAVQLTAVWQDPDFDAGQAAAYYLRVLEIPTPRWTTYLAAANGLPVPQDYPATVQARGWSSPIWYLPAKGQD